ncbi:putative bifunctional diguanylate cyclase/phosphodiesterase [Terricaulis sp.]|uniref:putative bifunctional diguanylate cyclase/phosphodiesterase n=1 Tax=Terricaulis sp. TaxID=2768686 RepID=UPI003784F443
MMSGKRRPKWRLFRDGAPADGGAPAWVYVLLFTASIALAHWSVERWHAVLLWPANGVLLAALLQLDKRRALAVLGACLVINIAGNALRADPPHMLVLNVVLNFGEVALAALLARRYCGATLDLRRPMRLARFAACIAAPVALSALIGVTARMDPPEVFALDLCYWFGVETLGFLVTTPTLLLLLARRERSAGEAVSPREKAVLMAALVAVTAAVFAQTYAPVLFLVFLPLLAIAFRLPPHWAAVSVVVVALIGGAFSFSGMGPITLSNLAPVGWPVNDVVPALNILPVLHLFISAALIVAFSASTILTERRRLERRLEQRTASALAARASAQAAERRVSHIAQHDPDTGLLNRLGLESEVTGMLEARYGRGVYVAALGVDRFASIRTAIGSPQTSLLIAETARRLAGRMPQTHVARLSSATLSVAMRAANLEEATQRLLQAREAFLEAVALGASRVDVRLTVGLAGAPEHAYDARSLIERAQVAMAQAYAGKASFAVYDAAAERQATSSLTLISELRDGLANGAVWLAHQPKLDLHTNEVHGVESLIRWSHIEKGPIGPDAFIPLSEETGFISPLTDWVFDRALVEQASLAQAGHALNFGVNISARSLCERGFAERLIGMAAARRASPTGLTLEITETAVMAEPMLALANLEKLKAAGFMIAVDDYGAGMSSLSYLKRIPADELKIDASFIRTLAENNHDAVLVRSTIDLGHSLGLKVVAEGVEDQETLDMLALFGCDRAQGYLIARPLPLLQLPPIVVSPPVRAQRPDQPKLVAVPA